MNSNFAIQATDLSKEYLIGGAEQRHDSFREALKGTLTSPLRKLRRLGGDANDEERFWALKDVNFTVEQGEVLGIIGRNGAGKSTLLKVLSRITSPTKGRIITRGRMASLLEVGTGFHPELTGRENIYLNGAILGMSRAEIDYQFDEIVSFAEIEKFLDTPVKRYSSGMYVRLAFSVAAHLKSDILLVDEVLAVGDTEFQKRCLGKMQEVSSAGRSVIFISHNLPSVLTLCDRVIWLQDGAVKGTGEPQSLIHDYLATATTKPSRNKFEYPAKSLIIESVTATVSGSPSQVGLVAGETCYLSIALRATKALDKLDVAIGIYDEFSRPLGILQSGLEGKYYSVSEGQTVLVCKIDGLALFPGSYLLNASVTRNGELIDGRKECAKMVVSGSKFFEDKKLPRYGPLLFRSDWQD